MHLLLSIKHLALFINLDFSRLSTNYILCTIWFDLRCDLFYCNREYRSLNAEYTSIILYMEIEKIHIRIKKWFFFLFYRFRHIINCFDFLPKKMILCLHFRIDFLCFQLFGFGFFSCKYYILMTLHKCFLIFNTCYFW